VAVARPGEPFRDPGADAVISFDPAVPISVRAADCVPILVADTERRAVAAIHAGWRGTCANVAGATVERLADQGVPASDLIAALGPSIGPCCYQVGENTRAAFTAAAASSGWFSDDGPGHWRLDLWRAATEQLEHAGVRAERIHVSRLCTFDRADVCFSFRREGAGTGRLVAAIRLAGADGH
jgi:YfiH family protein